MIQLYADNRLAYDSRLEEYDLEKLTATTGLNVGGTAEIVLPFGHPAYDFFVSHRTVVEIYRDNDLRFRGRALYPADDFNRSRTIICEGELCFLRDAICRPYLYQADPATIFAAVMGEYNAQVDDWKQFRVGEVTVTDANDYTRFESESAETVQDTVNKLLERCGGYIVFTTAEDGARVINWLASVGSNNNQSIEFGENLLDFSSTGENTALATGLIPYGAKDEETGETLTIESVNGGKDYILAADAQAIRGTIMTTATWEDVTEPEHLLQKARAYLDECKVFVTSLTLSALDLSYMNKDLDSFIVGDYIRIKSVPHGVNEDFQLTQLTEDFINPANSTINLGKDITSLTGGDVSGDREGQKNVTKTESRILLSLKEHYATKEALSELEETLTAKIATMDGTIVMEVAGSLGSEASIVLSVNGAAQSHKLDLSRVREAFANDKSEVLISGGKVTFQSGTFVVDSTNLRISADGTIAATNAELSGNLTTESGSYKSRLSSGRLGLFYAGEEYGSLSSGYFSTDDTVRGLALRLETGAKYMAFSKRPEDGEAYSLYYCLNFGANPEGHTERHIFNGSARFGGVVYADSHIYLANNYTLRCATSEGASAPAVQMGTDDCVYFGSLDYSTYLRGYTLFLGDSSANTFIHGNWIYLKGKVFVDKVPITFANGYGFKGRDKAGSDHYLFSIDSNNNVAVGTSSYPLILKGSTVRLGSSSGTTVTSDRRMKNSIEALPGAYLAALDGLQPVRYKYNDGKSDRFHVGFIAQEVQEALEAAGLTAQDFGGFVDLNGDGTELGLIYEEFIGLLLMKIKQLEQRFEALSCT